MRQRTSVYELPAGRTNPSPRLVEMFSRQIGAFIGIGLMIAIALAGIALATWNVRDPSFSYANSNPVTNLLGYPGAVFADLAMQFFGLGSVAALLPLFFWAVLLMGQHNITRLPYRLIFWIISIFAFCGLIALISPFANWPLPLGLGGVVGDKVLDFFNNFFAALPVYIYRPVVALILCPIALWSVMVAGGVLKRSRAKTKAVEKFEDFNDEEDFVGDEPRLGFFASTTGLVMHWWLTATSTIRRVFFKNKKPRDDYAPKAKKNRVEPDFYAHAVENASWEDAVDALEEVTPVAEKSRRKAATPKNRTGFILPELDYLAVPRERSSHRLTADALEKNAEQLKSILEDFGVRGEIIHANPGPVVTLYEFEPAPGIKSSRVIGLADDIARSMSAVSARVAVVPGRNVIGIELPNATRETVYLREIMETQDFHASKAKLALALGKAIGGEPVIADLAKMPHLLVAGTTGSGKSVAINTMILSLLYRMTPDECRFIMVDPKMLELSVYDGIPHLLTPVVTEPKKAVVALKWAVREMEERYRKMAKLGVRNIDGYNNRIADANAKGEALERTMQTGFDKQTGEPVYETEALDNVLLPYIVVIIDEMADLMLVAGKEIEAVVQRLAQMARAAGIHVVTATQRPSVDVITGTIKANFPTRISFSVTSKIDSRTILGETGAEQLLGQGDMLFMMGGTRTQRVHGPFVSDDEVEAVVSHLRAQGTPDYLESITEEDESFEGPVLNTASGDGSDDLYDQAVATVLRDRKVSTSYIQRRLGIGYNRAATIVERMEEEGLISAPNHVGKREILVPEGNTDF